MGRVYTGDHLAMARDAPEKVNPILSAGGATGSREKGAGAEVPARSRDFAAISVITVAGLAAGPGSASCWAAGTLVVAAGSPQRGGGGGGVP
jgi:hypothetical protein